MRGLVPRIHVFLICCLGSIPPVLRQFAGLFAISGIIPKRGPALSDERSESVVDLACVARVLQRLTAEVASLRDGMRVLTAIVQRLDNAQGRMLEELRAMHQQQSRFGERLLLLEEQHSP